MSAGAVKDGAPASTQEAPQLRIVIVGHVDHGKSTFVGRLLHDTNSLPDGKLEAIQASCRKRGVDFEFAFLMDALQSERDQNITIDTAQIWFRTPLRQYVVIDAPGHKEFIKNMVTGAAQADAAFLLIAANEGVQEQSRRHGTLLSLLGIKQVVVLVNKMDLAGYDQAVFDRIESEYRAFLKGLGVEPMAFLPMSAREGANVAHTDPALAWYQGPTVLGQLDRFQAPVAPTEAPLRFPVQDVYRFDERRILAGRIESGSVKVGDELVFWPGGKRSTVASVERWSAPSSASAGAGESVGLTLTEQIFVERGHIASRPESPLIQGHEIHARVFWLGKQPLVKGRRYKLKLATQEVDCEVKEIRAVLDSSSLDSRGEAEAVQRNEVAELVLSTRKPVAFDNHDLFVGTGRFVLVDGYDMAGGGIIFDHAYSDTVSTNIHFNHAAVTTAEREALKGHRGAVVWFTGLSGSGKSTIANALERELTRQGVHCYELDGDNLRFGLNRDLGFSDADRRENIRRAAEVALLFSDSATVVITSLISPFREDRARARELARERKTPFFEVFVDAPLAVCESRDPKGLYAKARRGELAQFTGISSPYEAPLEPSLTLHTDQYPVEACVTQVMDLLMGTIRPRK
ncbi:MAG TPA: adenylyl-sulfate kinase [bacterium]|nr:adenylyl-sulfate kinase [bacterium]